MAKRIIAIVVAAIMLLGVFGLTACDNISLDEYKVIGKALIDAHVTTKTQSDYITEKWAELLNVAAEGKQAVEGATNKGAVDAAVNEAKIMIDVVQKEDEVAEWTLLDSSNCCAEFEQSEAYTENFAKSMAAYDEAIALFTTTDGKYTNDFGGVFVDGNGIHNICVVGNREPVKSDYLIYKQVDNTYNFLESIVEEVGNNSQEYSVWTVATCQFCNKVLICLENESKIPLLVEHLKSKDLFKKGALNIYIGENGIAPN